jgi:hypothetical protein
MNRIVTILSAAAVLGLPSLASADKPTTNPGKGHDQTPQGQAYGKSCQAESKKHVKGEKGTPYSRCVVAAAQAEKDAPATR